MRLAKPIVGMTSSASGLGYDMVANDGGVFAFGDAGFFGSNAPSPSPVVALSMTASGNGYLVAMANAAVAPFGDAEAFGPRPALNAPIVGMARQR